MKKLISRIISNQISVLISILVYFPCAHSYNLSIGSNSAIQKNSYSFGPSLAAEKIFDIEKLGANSNLALSFIGSWFKDQSNDSIASVFDLGVSYIHKFEKLDLGIGLSFQYGTPNWKGTAGSISIKYSKLSELPFFDSIMAKVSTSNLYDQSTVLFGFYLGRGF